MVWRNRLTFRSSIGAAITRAGPRGGRGAAAAALALAGAIFFSAAGVLFAQGASGPTQDPEVTAQEIARLRLALAELTARLDRLERQAARPSTPVSPAAVSRSPGAPDAPADSRQPAASGPHDDHGQDTTSQDRLIAVRGLSLTGNFHANAGGNAIDPHPSLELHGVELGVRAALRRDAKAVLALCLDPDHVGIEQAFVSVSRLPLDLTVKLGKIRASFGQVNQACNSDLPWIDRPLVTMNLLGGEPGINDAGVSISRIFGRGPVALEATAELLRGDSTVFRAWRDGDLTWVGRLRGSGRAGQAWDAEFGSSFAYGTNDSGPGLATRLVGLDARVGHRPVTVRSEVVWSRRAEPLGVRRSFGGYAAGDVQVARLFGAGVRVDRSDRWGLARLTDSSVSLVATVGEAGGTRLRTQYRRVRYGEGPRTDQLLFQVLFAVGAHQED